MEILCIGLNHETAPVSIREKLAFTSESLREALAWVKAQSGIQEVLILSTCNRVEFYLVSEEKALHATRVIRQFFHEKFGFPSLIGGRCEISTRYCSGMKASAGP